jgi:hypothetical protein
MFYVTLFSYVLISSVSFLLNLMLANSISFSMILVADDREKWLAHAFLKRLSLKCQ